MVTGFRLVGIEGVEVRSVEETKVAFSQALTRNDVAIIAISQQFSGQLQPEIAKARTQGVTPMIVEIPGAAGTVTGSNLSELVSKTLGIKV